MSILATSPFISKKIIFYLVLLKRYIKLFPKKTILYKSIGLVCEYIGNLFAAMRFYLIFLKKETLNLKIWNKYTIFTFWQNTKFFLNHTLIKYLTKYSLFYTEMVIFKLKTIKKIRAQWAFQIWKNFIKKNLVINFSRIKKIQGVNLLIYNGILWIRSARSFVNSILRNLIFLKTALICCMHLKSGAIINYIICHQIIYICLVNVKHQIHEKINIRVIFFFSKNCPFFIKILQQVFSIHFTYSKRELSKILFIAFNIYAKWFNYLGLNINRKNYFFFLYSENYTREYFRFSDSYDIFSRVSGLKLNLYIKISKNQKSKNMTKYFEIYKIIAQKWPESFFPILVVVRVFQIISIEKKKSYFICKYLKNVPKNTRSNDFKSLINEMEIFFEKKKILGLSHLIFSVFFLNFRALALFSKKRQSFYKKDKNSCLINNTSAILKNFMYFKSCKEKYSFFNQKDNYVIKNLIKIIFIFILTNRVSLFDKKIGLILSSCSYFYKAELSCKFILLLLSFKKKKHKRSYDCFRSICLQNPNFFLLWCAFLKLKNKFSHIVSKELRFVLRLLNRHPDLISGIVFVANKCSSLGSYSYALAEFFQVYRWKKSYSYLTFSICLQYLYKSLNRKNRNLEYPTALSLCFFFDYISTRFFTIESHMKRSKKSRLLKMEIFFNKANFYLFLNLKYLSLVVFLKILNQKNQKLTFCKRGRNFYNESNNDFESNSLFNIQLFYTYEKKQIHLFTKNL